MNAILKEMTPILTETSLTTRTHKVLTSQVSVAGHSATGSPPAGEGPNATVS